MILIENVELPDGSRVNREIPSAESLTLDGSQLLLMPALIDPHVHFRTPGLEHKETLHTAAKAALRGGVTTFFDMPNTLPACITLERMREKKARIDAQLAEVGIPLRYGLYFGADKDHFEEIAKAKEEAIGLKVFMGSSTGDLVMDDESSLHAAFALAKAHDLVVAVHAEDEALITQRMLTFTGSDPALHSIIRCREAAYRATKKAIALAELYGTRLYILHVSTREEVELIREAKAKGVDLYAEVTPHHLFLNEEAYPLWGNKVVVNPPLREREDNEALFAALQEGIIDTVGSDHAPHTRDEKSKPYGSAPAGIPGIETALPLLLDSGRLTIPQIIRCMRTRIQELFRLPDNDDLILVDLNKKRKVVDEEVLSASGWSPYAGRVLQGWPVGAILKGRFYAC